MTPEIHLMRYARLALLLLLGTCVTLARADQPLKLINPDEHNGGWSFDNGQEFPGATGSLSLDPTVKHDDRPSIKLHGDFTKGGNYVQCGRTIPHTNPKLLSFWLKFPGASQLTMRLIDSDGTCHQLPLQIKKTDDWQHIQFPVNAFFENMGTPNAVPGVTRYEKWGGKDKGWNQPLTAVYFLIGRGADKTNTLWLDDVEIIPDQSAPLTKAPEHLEDFEDANLAAGWNFTGEVSQTAAEAYKGDHALRMSRTEDTINAPTSAVSKPFPAAPGKWEFTGATRGNLYSPDNSYHGRINIQWLNAAGSVIEQSTLELTTRSPAWKPFRKTLEAPEQTVSARYEISLQKTYGWYEVDHLNAVQTALAQLAEKRIDQVHLKSDVTGNLFEPDQPVVLHMTVQALKPLEGDELNATCVIRDYWGAEVDQPLTVALTGGKEVKSHFIYTADIDLSPLNLKIGKYYEIHATVHPRSGGDVTEYRGLARLPKPVTWEHKSSDVPFTIRNWDSRIGEYMRLAHRLGIRNIGTWGGYAPNEPYNPKIPGIDTIESLGDSIVSGTPASEVERGSDKYSLQQLHDGMVAFMTKFKHSPLTMLALGNEPHGGPEQIKKNVAAYKAVYEAAKSVDPDIFVIATSVGPDEEYFRNGYYKYCDAYDFHTYEGYQGIKNAIAGYKALMTKYNAGKPIFSTEMGSNSQGMTRYAVAVEMVKKFTVFFAEGGANASWFTIMYPDNAGKARGTFGDAHCVFDCRYSEYNPRIDAITYYNMVNGICVKKFIEQKDYDGVRAFLFADSDNHCLQILWNEGKRRDIQLPLTGVKSARLIRIDGSDQQLDVPTGGVNLGINDEPLLLLYDQPSPKLVASVKPAQFQLDSPIHSVVKGGSTTFRLSGNADALKVVAPPQWTVELKQVAAKQVEATVNAPLKTDAREGRLLIQQTSANNAVTGEIIVSVPVTDQLEVQLLPGPQTPTQAGAVRLVVTNYQNAPADVDWELDLLKQYPMSNGAYKMSEGESPTAFFSGPNSGRLSLKAGQSQTISVPLASVDPQTLYRIGAVIRDATGRSTEMDRLFGGFVNVPKAKQKINIDGKLDEAAWADAPVETIGEQRQSFTFGKVEAPATWTGPEDLSGKVRFLWDDQYFYVSVEVTDDVFAGKMKDGSIWNMDGLQFLIDPKRDSVDKPGKYDYAVADGAKGPQVWCNFSASQSVPNGEVKSVILSIKRKDPNNGNMIYEMAFPWATLAPFQPQVSANLGLCIILNEDDGPGRKGFVGWFSGAHSKDLDVVGDLILGE